MKKRDQNTLDLKSTFSASLLPSYQYYNTTKVLFFLPDAIILPASSF